MAAAPCSGLIFERAHCIPSQASSVDVVANKVGEWRSLNKRFIFQSVSKNISKLELERKVWGSRKDDELGLAQQHQ